MFVINLNGVAFYADLGIVNFFLLHPMLLWFYKNFKRLLTISATLLQYLLLKATSKNHHFVIASEAKQSKSLAKSNISGLLRRYAPRNDG